MIEFYKNIDTKQYNFQKNIDDLCKNVACAEIFNDMSATAEGRTLQDYDLCFIKNHKIIGILTFVVANIELSNHLILYIQQIMFDKEHRRQGVCTALIERALQYGHKYSHTLARIDTDIWLGDKLAKKYNFEYFGKRLKMLENYKMVCDHTYYCYLANICFNKRRCKNKIIID